MSLRIIPFQGIKKKITRIRNDCVSLAGNPSFPDSIKTHRFNEREARGQEDFQDMKYF